jgi:hypothetical protein
VFYQPNVSSHAAFFQLFFFQPFLQKARLARIQIAKATSGAAFVSKKKAVEARIAAMAAGLPVDDNGREDIFEIQHHHLLRCLEKTTVKLSLKKSFVCPDQGCQKLYFQTQNPKLGKFWRVLQ